jgi:sterol desaturase/sphingolipid hydroxylase (fatty acid hydroxylase superfamily)
MYLIYTVDFYHIINLYYISQLIIYFIHRLPHQFKKPKFWFDAHVIGHHKLYDHKQFDSDVYLYKTNNMLYEADTYIFTIPLFIFYIFYNIYILQIQWNYFAILNSMLLFHIGMDIYIHKHVHLKNSYLNKFELFKKIKEHHRTHHIIRTKNYSFTNFIFDYVFGTYE